MSLFDAAIPSLFPEQFFDATVDVYHAEKMPSGRSKEKFLLPEASLLLDEEKFADLYLSWDSIGISLECHVQQPFSDSIYPRFDEGDSFELFFDTRDLKNVGVIHRFCHHFLFLPVEVQGVRALEITQFRGEDRHPLADPSEIIIDTVFEKRSYSYSIFLPREVLYGYDPASIPRLGFSYRIHRRRGGAQHFTISTRACPIERHPALWASLILKRN